MSVLPLPSKSPVPTTCHVARHSSRDRRRCARSGPLIPDRDRAVVVLPENVALAVAVEVAGADDMPAAGIPVAIVCPVYAIVPDRDRAVVALPENVALAVAVEVADAGQMPAGGYRSGDGGRAGGLSALPDRYGAAVLFCSRRSACPLPLLSKLKSKAPGAFSAIMLMITVSAVLLKGPPVPVLPLRGLTA